jgi:hypothetical protein
MISVLKVIKGSGILKCGHKHGLSSSLIKFLTVHTKKRISFHTPASEMAEDMVWSYSLSDNTMQLTGVPQEHLPHAIIKTSRSILTFNHNINTPKATIPHSFRNTQSSQCVVTVHHSIYFRQRAYYIFPDSN